MKKQSRLSRFTVVSLALFWSAAAGSQVTVPDDYPTIQAAIDAVAQDASLGDIVLATGDYQLAQPLSLASDITLRGRETARTFISGAGADRLVDADGVTGVTLRNLSFRDAALGVRLRDGAEVTLVNNVFLLGDEATAVSIDGFSDALVRNNVFYRNEIAVLAGSTQTLSLLNNIFAQNGTAIAPGTLDAVADTTISHNGFFNNGEDGPTGDEAVTEADTLFVDGSRFDFHLRANSEAIGAGEHEEEAVDLGAYGGPEADRIPFPIRGISATASADDAITVNWVRNRDHRVDGYWVYYGIGQAEGGADAQSESPIEVANAEANSLALIGLDPPAGQNLPAPELSVPQPLNERLALRWSDVEGATGYRVFWGIADVNENSLDVGDTTEHTLRQLDNDTEYRVQVAAYSQTTYHVNVAAYIGEGEDRQQSERLSAREATAAIGATALGLPSEELSATPERLVAPVDVEDRCFIATAAYGSYAAPHVLTLRAFRDSYLLTHSPGRALVSWYYRHSPRAAAWLDSNPSYKPWVRAALLPTVAVAGLLMEGYLPALLALVLLFLLAFLPLRRLHGRLS